jgi:hypothetical protein
LSFNFNTPIVAKELQQKSTKVIIDGWMDGKQHQHDVTMVVAN